MSSTVTVSRETLEATPERALKFIRAVARTPAIRASLQTYGYSPEVHAHGWELVATITGAGSGGSVAFPESTPARAALAQVNREDEQLFTLLDAVLKHRFPAVLARLTDGLAPSRDEARAVVVVAAVLERLDALEASTAAEDRQAMAILSQRGVTAEYRERLSALVATAQESADVAPLDTAALDAADADYLEQLRALRIWFEEWSGIARVAVTRRDLLIRLGLAQRRRSARDEDGADAEPAAVQSGV